MGLYAAPLLIFASKVPKICADLGKAITLMFDIQDGYYAAMYEVQLIDDIYQDLSLPLAIAYRSLFLEYTVSISSANRLPPPSPLLMPTFLHCTDRA